MSHFQIRMRTLVILTLCAFQSAPEILAADPIASLELQPDITVRHQNVSLSDVISGHHPAVSRSLLELDLYEFGESESSVTLSSEFIHLRLSLSSQVDDYELTGSDQVTVRFRPSINLTDRLIEVEASETVARLMRISIDELRVRLLTPVMSNWTAPKQSQASLDVDFVFPNPLQLGRQSALLRVMEGEALLGTKRILFEIATRQPILVLRSAVRRGERLTIHKLEQRSVFRTEISELTIAEAINCTVRRNRPAGTTLTHHDVETERNQISHPNIIQTRDAVRLVARKNGLKVVVPQAQAMQSGRVGQIIRVKNLTSNRIVTGRVINADEVVVDLQ